MKRSEVVLTLENKVLELERLKANSMERTGLEINNLIYDTSIGIYKDCIQLLVIKERPKLMHIEKAREYLVADSDTDIALMINAIRQNEDQTQLIDFIDGVDVWQKVEFEFTCDEFLELIS